MEFLKSTAEYLYTKYAGNISNIDIILPNRRSGLFLRRYLSQCIDKPVFLPVITSIQDFVMGLSGVRLADDFFAMVRLYESYVAVKVNDPESFDDFLHWGNKLLQDFDELDQHLADMHFVFTYLQEEKNLALWSLDKKPLSDFQKNYLEFYSLLYKIYLGFTERMNNEGYATYGMACRKVVAMLNESDNIIDAAKTVVFTGLNALSASEEFIINRFYEKGKAELLWDGDEYYINDTAQEAGNFIRKYIDRWHRDEPKWVSNDLGSQEKNITLVAVAGKIGQVKYAAGEISALLNQKVSSGQISVILNEESLLIPMLNSVPAEIDKFNITMGYPMKLSPVYNFIEIVFEMHENAERFRSVKGAKEPLYYYKDLQKLFSHYFIHIAVGGNQLLVSCLNRQEKIFYTRSEVMFILSGNVEKVPEAVENLFNPWYQQSIKAVECFEGFINSVRNSIFSKPGLDAEFLFTALKIFARIRSSIESADIALSAKTLHTLFTQNVAQTTVPFTGEPLSGLQIMGMLETRALDFDTVFLLSVNEGILPRGKSGTSFIPHGIRLDAGLPTYKQNEEIFAYHFYRILQRSKNIYLIYNTQPDDLGGGERSRFVNQLVYELPRRNPRVKISEVFVTFPPEKEMLEAIVIDKDKEILARLDLLAEKGLSPSALNIFRKCSLQYYYNYVAGISETEELSETIDSREFGDQIHQVLEELFSAYAGKSITDETIKGFQETYEEVLRKNFEKDNSRLYDRMSGKNLLIYHVIKDYLRKFLQKQREILIKETEEHVEHKVLFVEKEIRHNFSLTLGDGSRQVLLKGFTDRIDVIGNTMQIIDYKSGDASKKNFDIDKLLADEQDYKNDYCFQVMLYLWLISKEFADDHYAGHYCGVWSFRNIEAGVKNVYYCKDPGVPRSEKIYSLEARHLKDFEEMLNSLLIKLFDPAVDFVQTENPDNCELCPYRLMCGK